MAANPVRIQSKESAGSEVPYILIAAREIEFSKLLRFYLVTGLFFMLVPGTFLGVWNLISISSQHGLAKLSPDWVQAHGHAQVFGWIGSFILGIGFYSLPHIKL